MAAWGVEARVPFLDKEFLDVAMRLDPADKMITEGRIEKHVLREAFGDLLPDEIAWRQKEQFSDGVGYGWIDAVKDFTAAHVTDADMARAQGRFPFNPPASKEAYWFRAVFERHFPQASAARTVPGGPTIACSTPEAVQWDKALQAMNDPSGRAMCEVHKDGY
jgi:asparagine synthase (glutamine-hydrolysing)